MAKTRTAPFICCKCGAEFSTSLALRAHSGHHIKKIEAGAEMGKLNTKTVKNLLVVKTDLLAQSVKSFYDDTWKIKVVHETICGEGFANIFVAVSINDYESTVEKEAFQEWAKYIPCRLYPKGRIVFI